MNAAGIKAKREQYGAHLKFKNRNKDVFAWDAEDDLNELMGNNSQVTHPNIPSEFLGVLLGYDHDFPTATVENLAVDDNVTAAGAAANAGIQNCEDDPAGDQPPPLIMDYESIDDNDDGDNNGDIAGVNVLPVDTPIELPVAESSQEPDSNENATYVVQP